MVYIIPIWNLHSLYNSVNMYNFVCGPRLMAKTGIELGKVNWPVLEPITAHPKAEHGEQ